VVADKAAAAMTAGTTLSTAQGVQRLASQQARVELGERLVEQLGASSAGFWLDQQNDAVVVNVTDQQATAKVRQAGAVAKVVAHNTATLESIQAQLAAMLPTDASAGIDVAANRIEVQIGPKASGSTLATLENRARALGSVVEVTRVSESFTTLIVGGYPIVGASGGRCSLGFLTTNLHAVTAGHCTQSIGQWWEGCYGNGYFGPSVGASFPGNDYGQIRNDGGLVHDGSVHLYGHGPNQDITTAANPAVGMALCKSGSTTGLTCGLVTNINVSVNYSQGRVDGLAESNAYAAPGDSGGPWFTDGTAVGLTSGKNNITNLTYFQPVIEALNAYGVWVV